MLIRLKARFAGASWGAEDMAVLFPPTTEALEGLGGGNEGIFTGDAGLCIMEAGD